MKLATVFVSVAAAYSPFGTMETCVPGFQYCGGTLRNRGSNDEFYIPIKKALSAFHKNPSDELISKTIFYCDSAYPRKVLFMRTCGDNRECVDGDRWWWEQGAKCLPKGVIKQEE
ncbi:hypothetical protein CP533_5170 [Ophiocordyceps camponoti-saundersi (nom. inval.)]|nr:hypothetical protein CP533_5170 [Ophiocordyceps camponoti-saundersi (nom. inval.)]